MTSTCGILSAGPVLDGPSNARSGAAPPSPRFTDGPNSPSANTGPEKPSSIQRPCTPSATVKPAGAPGGRGPIASRFVSGGPASPAEPASGGDPVAVSHRSWRRAHGERAPTLQSAECPRKPGEVKQIDEQIASLAAGQRGLVTRAQLLRLGMPASTITWRLKTKRFRPVQRGVFQVGPLQDQYMHEMAAVLACGHGTVLSHGSAGAVWRLLTRPDGPLPVDVLLPGTDRGRRPGIRAHRCSRPNPDETTVTEGLPITTPARTVLDLAADLRARELEQALGRAVDQRLTTPTELAALIARHPRSPGVGKLRALLQGHGPPSVTESEAEERFLSLIRRALLPRPGVNVLIEGCRVDFLWPAERLLVEVDGFAYHSTQRKYDRDRRRDAEFAAKGYQVLRVTWRQIVHEPEATLCLVAQALAMAAKT